MASSAAVVRWAPIPETVLRGCQAAQARTSFPLLCPTALPRPILGGRPGDPPPPIRADPIPGGRHRVVGVDIGYGAPTEQGEPHWRAHMWRNRPCCFLHLEVERVSEIPSRARPRLVGGLLGRVLLASGGYAENGPDFGNHVRFYFHRSGLSYLASLHAPYVDGDPRRYDNAATLRTLGEIVRHLAATRRISEPPAPPRGAATPTGSVGGIAGAAGRTAVWVADAGSVVQFGPHAFDEPRLVRVDPTTGRVVARISAGDLRGDVAVGAGAVWAASLEARVGGIVARVDPHTNRVVARIHAGTWPRALAFAGNTVWVADSAPFYRRGTLVRIDATTNRLVGRPIPIGSAPTAIAVADGALWVADAHEDVVRRLDLRTRHTLATIAVGRSPYAIVSAFGSIWVTNADDGTVSRIDPRTNRTAATIRLGGNPYGIAAGGSDVWVANLGSGTLAGIDPTTNLTLPPVHVATDPVAVTAGPAGLWATTPEGVVTRLRSLH